VRPEKDVRVGLGKIRGGQRKMGYLERLKTNEESESPIRNPKGGVQRKWGLQRGEYSTQWTVRPKIDGEAKPKGAVKKGRKGGFKRQIGKKPIAVRPQRPSRKKRMEENNSIREIFRRRVRVRGEHLCRCGEEWPREEPYRNFREKEELRGRTSES